MARSLLALLLLVGCVDGSPTESQAESQAECAAVTEAVLDHCIQYYEQEVLPALEVLIAECRSEP